MQAERINRLEDDVRELQKSLNGKMDNVNRQLGEIHEKINKIAESTVINKVRLGIVIAGISMFISVIITLIINGA
jgi:hypothetical protein